MVSLLRNFLLGNFLRNLSRYFPGYLASVALTASCSLFCVPEVELSATPSSNSDVLARRGSLPMGEGTEAPTLTLTSPAGGWTSGLQFAVAGVCSDPTASPIQATINGVRYYINSNQGIFSKKFPASPGKNVVEVECHNRGGSARVDRTLHAVTPPIPLKVVLTSDTNGVYTDLHVYEPDGRHVYWADTNSPSGGIFFLNSQEGSFDMPGYGPYLYIHAAPPPGVYRIDANYWPGGAVQHALANLDVILNEGETSESRQRVRKPLARPGETVTMAYVVVRGNKQPPVVYIPGQSNPQAMPPEVVEYKKVREPEINKAVESDSSDDSTDGDNDGDNGSASNGGGVLISPQQLARETGGSSRSPLGGVLSSRNAVQQIDFPEAVAHIHEPDAERMRKAVSVLALLQAKKVSPLWEDGQRDCAGLVRFVYREALRTRDQQRLNHLGVPRALLVPTVSDDARAVFPSYPKIWTIGYDKSGAETYDFFADAEILIGYNFISKGKDVANAQSADVLVFARSLSQDEPYHIMLYVDGPGGGVGERSLVVYHNGAAGNEAQVRVVPLTELFSSPDPTWSPVVNNPAFLGVFEWKKFQIYQRTLRAS